VSSRNQSENSFRNLVGFLSFRIWAAMYRLRASTDELPKIDATATIRRKRGNKRERKRIQRYDM